MYISLLDLGVFLVVILALAVGSFLLVALANVNRLVAQLNRKITENSPQVELIIENLKESSSNVSVLTGILRKNQELLEEKIPGSINNIYAITSALKSTGEKVDNSLDLVHAGLLEAATTVTENAQDLLAYVKVVGEGIKIIIEMFHRK